MKKPFILFSIVILLFTISCSSDSGDEDPVQSDFNEYGEAIDEIVRDEDTGKPKWTIDSLFTAKDYNSKRDGSTTSKFSPSKAFTSINNTFDNPLGSRDYLLKRSEFFISGIHLDEQGTNTYVSKTKSDNWRSFLFQDKDTDTGKFDISSRYDGEGGGWKCPKKSIGADVDGDGREEIIIALFDGQRRKLRKIDSDSSDKTVGSTEVLNIAAYTDFEPENEVTYNDSDGKYQRTYMGTDITAGDIDGDGRDEIIFSSGRELYIRNDEKKGFAKLVGKTYNIFDDSDKSYYFIRLATADFNLDGRDELVVVVGNDKPNTAKYYIYDFSSSLTEPVEMKTGYISMMYNGNTYALRAADITTGDFDHDGLPEIAFGGRYKSSDIPGTNSKVTEKWYFMVLNTEMNDNKEPVFSWYNDVASGSSYDSTNGRTNIMPPMNAGDIDGDGYPEIIAGKQILYLAGVTSKNSTASIQRMWEGKSPSVKTPSINDVIVDAEDGKMTLYDLVCIGDVTKDGKDDIVFITRDEKYINILSDKDGSRSAKRILLKVAYDVEDNDLKDTFPVICSADIDEDSLKVRYIGHEVIYSEVDIAAVIDSAPYWKGINGSDEGFGGGTTYAQGKTVSTEESRINSITVGASFGYGYENVTGTNSFEVRASASHCWSWGWSKTQERTDEWGFTSALGEAKVYLIRVPYDVYYYKIKMSPNSTEREKIVSIDVPRTIENVYVSLDYYNNSVADYNIAITEYNSLNSKNHALLSSINIGHTL